MILQGPIYDCKVVHQKDPARKVRPGLFSTSYPTGMRHYKIQAPHLLEKVGLSNKQIYSYSIKNLMGPYQRTPK